MSDPVRLLLLLAAVAAPVLAGTATLLLPRRSVTPRVLVALLGPIASAAALLVHGIGGEPVGIPYAPSIDLELSFVVDRLGGFFGLLVSGIGALIVLYARGYFGPDAASLRRFYPALGLFATAMMGIVLSDNLLGMFLFWELTSVSSFLLIGWNREDPRAVRLALQAFATTGLGGMALLGGVIALGVATDTWSFSALGAGIGGAEDGLLLAAFVLLFVGGAAKSAQWPLHFWLPGAMAAPTPVSAYLHSATMVKAGVYLFARLHPTLSELGWWPPVLVAIGAVTMLLGGVLALGSNELKRIFAYTTVSQLGLLTCMYGLGGLQYDGDANLIWPVTQIANHALYKAPLFILAGAVMKLTGRKHLDQLRGLLRTQPIVAGTMLVAAYAMAGLPFTLSFTAKEAFLYQIVHGAREEPGLWAVAAMAVLTAACNVAIFVRMTRFFLAPADERAAGKPRESGFWGACLWWPAVALVAGQLLGGVWPGGFDAIIRPVETHVLGGSTWTHLPGFVYAITHPGTALALSGAAIGLGVVIGIAPVLRGEIADPHARLFPISIRWIERLGHLLFATLQSGNLFFYVLVVLAGLVVGLGGVLAVEPDLRSWPQDLAPLGTAPIALQLTAVLLTVLVCLSACVLPFIQRRVVRVLVLGSCGFAVTGMYLIYQAPDLALTQLMFEIISVILFMLALRLLPEGPLSRTGGSGLLRAGFASIVGLGIGWTVIHAGSVADRSALDAHAEAVAAGRFEQVAEESGKLAPEVALLDLDRVSWFFLNHSYAGSEFTGGRGGGGNNVVNVILVDFRGYDTLGEIAVLVVTMMGVLALLGSVPRQTSAPPGAVGLDIGPQPHLRSILLRTGVRLILPMSLLFAGYVFFKGHQEPGGGFIAGLIAAVGLAVHRMSEGRNALRRLLPFKPGLSAAAGLVIAMLTGLVPLVASALPFGGDGGSFLKSDNAYVDLVGGGTFHWASVLFFDLGVFIVVVAVSVGMINRFEEELE